MSYCDFSNKRKDEEMSEDFVNEIFDVDLVRLWVVDEDGNANEAEIEIEEPEIEVNIFGDGQCYWF